MHHKYLSFLKKSRINTDKKLFVIVTIFITIGIYFLIFSKAASPSAHLEAEAGIINAPAVNTPDTTASGGHTIRFGQSAAVETQFSLIIVPDTQQETGYNPAKFTSRMQWIADNKASLDIKFVVQVGDLVDTDNCGAESLIYLDPPTNKRPQCNSDMLSQKVYYPLPQKTTHYQYKNATTGLSILDAAKIPYSLAVGNHDSAVVCGGPACVGANTDWGVPAGTTSYSLQRTTTTHNTYFPQSRVQNVDEKGFFEANKTDNYYQTFQAGGIKWLVLSLELWPRPEAVNWAKTVVANHPSYNVIINTHNYLSPSGTIMTSQDGYGSTTPQYLFDNLIKVYPNIRLVFSGHLPTTAQREDTGTNGNKIYSFLDCYHDGNNNQTRIMKIDTKNNSIITDVYNNPADPTTKRTDGSHTITNISWVR